MTQQNIFVTRPSMPAFDEFTNEISDMWETGILTHQGPKHQRLNRKLEEFMETPNVTLFANGHLALELGLHALGLAGEVITTPFTFASTTQAILRNGLVPIFCDIRPDDFTLDPDKIERLVTDKTCAIVPVHVYGNICNVDAIQRIAERHKLKVIYDGAHAFGETYHGKNVAAFGDMVMFSFHATKVFSTVEGGCLVYRDASQKEFLEGLRQFGQIVKTEKTPYVGTNAKMTEMHAAMGLCNLRHFAEYITKRESVVKRYRRNLANAKGIQLNVIQEDVRSNYAYFPIIVHESRAGFSVTDVMEALAKQNIFVRRYFYPLCSNFECITERGIMSDVPTATYISDRVITLPCYSDLPLDDVDRISAIILSLY